MGITGVEYFRHSDSNGKIATFTPWGYSAVDMTAIVSVYTSDGFIVGADGLRVAADKSTILSETAQKLFLFQTNATQLIYAWCGTTQFFGRDGNCLFDFLVQTHPLLTMASLYGPTDFVAFLHFIRTGLDTILRQSRLVKSGDSFPIDLNSELARVLLVGYFKGEPCKAEIATFLQNGMLMPVTIPQIQFPSQHARDIFSGSKKAFARFEQTYPQDRDQAIGFVRDYIQACIENPDPGQIFGGRIHMAELNPMGFRWVDAPQNSN
jgi:hypothetical protein